MIDTSLLSLHPAAAVIFVIFFQHDAGDTDVAFLVDDERHRRQCSAHTWPAHAFAGAHIEQCAMLAAQNAQSIAVEELAALPVEVNAVVRASVLVAEYMLAPTDDEDKPRPDLSVLMPAGKHETLGTAVGKLFEFADGVHR